MKKRISAFLKPRKIKFLSFCAVISELQKITKNPVPIIWKSKSEGSGKLNVIKLVARDLKNINIGYMTDVDVPFLRPDCCFSAKNPLSPKLSGIILL